MESANNLKGNCVVIAHPMSTTETRPMQEITNDFLQDQVGGYFELLRPDFLPEAVVLICNEDAFIKNLPFNGFFSFKGRRKPILGTIVFCAERFNGKEWGLYPLTPEEAAAVRAYIE